MKDEERKNALAGLIAMVFLLAFSVLSSVGVMVYGWGLRPRSWWWIIGVGFVVQVVIQVVMKAIQD